MAEFWAGTTHSPNSLSSRTDVSRRSAINLKSMQARRMVGGAVAAVAGALDAGYIVPSGSLKLAGLLFEYA
jgi:hypothetical protein